MNVNWFSLQQGDKVLSILQPKGKFLNTMYFKLFENHLFPNLRVIPESFSLRLVAVISIIFITCNVTNAQEEKKSTIQMVLSLLFAYILGNKKFWKSGKHGTACNHISSRK